MEAKSISSWGSGSDHGCCHVSSLANYATSRCMVPECWYDGTDRVVLPYGYIPAYSLLRHCFRYTARPMAVPQPL